MGSYFEYRTVKEITLQSIVDVPLEQNIILQFNANLVFLHYYSNTTIYIAFCNKLLGGDIEKTISNAFDIITKKNIKRLLIHDSRNKNNVSQIKNLFEKHLANSATYHIELIFLLN